MLKSLIRKLVPENLINLYHKYLAVLSAQLYGNPSDKMIVIGVTGTNGKSTTVALIAKTLEAGGYRVGYTSTVGFKVADKEWLNNKKMTMLGRFQLQKLLKQMVEAGCRYAVIETSSQGIVQSRHLGINYDYVVFTNLTPEHIEAHGGFENYKNAKGELFKHLTERPWKKIEGKHIKKTIVANMDDEHSAYFLSFPADKKLTYSDHDHSGNIFANNIQVTNTGTSFNIGLTTINLQLLGAFNVYNALVSVTIALEEGIELQKIKQGLEAVPVIPGRMELINEGQDFTVLVDYCPEPYSMRKMYETIVLLKKNKIIHVFGSCGGGRDVARRPILGKLVGEKADIAIVTNEDPYDDNPETIIDQVVAGAVEAGKAVNQNLYKIINRQEAIEKALNLAQIGDLVLVTGKGAEQAMAVAGGKHIPWDDREVIREVLKSL
ncbi:MAG: UDP-N-acetylmuramyl-tripeptide synthetase [Parcubacteria group bacterium GW2011_GWC2_39_14]|nr:MAG: UDP-N-acetylmuramyl-tripeptide synthetase [Parcubacteria group bacterium GW2011_GWC2_39_14]KKR53807.1 MAG: UDP-N-acetylmuramyl-tripeptide synthetase [Parcubacteria group bacterium GW2011_GWA2_40_23]